jgi:hypothetical protein
MLVPGPWRDATAIVGSLQLHGIRSSARSQEELAPGAIAVEVVEEDRLADGFSWGRLGRLPDELMEAIGKAGRAALVEVAASLASEPTTFGRLGRALWQEGGLAVRLEGSGAASEWEPWLARVESAAPEAIYAASVLVVQGSNEEYFTCGMHQFDLPDSQIVMADSAAAIDWLDTFNIFQLAERPTLGSGHTVSPAHGSARRALERWPDHRHHPEDGRYNPFGIWRHVHPVEARVKARELVPVIMPSLVAVLAAKERESGVPLTSAEVAAIVARSPCIAMKLPHAIALERSRGYADLEPELAWEQWELVRRAL